MEVDANFDPRSLELGRRVALGFSTYPAGPSILRFVDELKDY